MVSHLKENLYFEKIVIAKMLKFEELKKQFKLSPEYFEDERHQNIANMLLNNINFNKEQLITQAAMDTKIAGDYDFVREIIDMDIVTKHGFMFDQEQVLKAFKIRQLDDVIQNYQASKEDETIAEISKEIHALSQIDINKNNSKTNVLAEMFESLFSDTAPPILKTKFDNLDNLIDGFEMNQFNIIAARPSMGKTAFALQMAKNMQSEDTEVIFCSAESSEMNVSRRIVSNISGVPLNKFKQPNLLMTMEDIDKVTTAIGIYSNMNITVIENAIFTPNKIRSIVQGMDPDKNKVLFIDYLQLMKTDGQKDRRFDEVSEISRELKIISMETPKLTINALSQLSRAVEQRQDKRPVMSDIRETGQIEQDAHLIMFLYRDAYYNHPEPGDPSENDLEIITAKNKDGPTGTSTIQFYPENQRMY